MGFCLREPFKTQDASDRATIPRNATQDWVAFNSKDTQGEIVPAEERMRHPQFAPLPARCVGTLPRKLYQM